MNDKDRTEIVKLIQDEITTRERYKLTLDQYQQTQIIMEKKLKRGESFKQACLLLWFAFAGMAWALSWPLWGLLIYLMSLVVLSILVSD